DVRAPNSLSRRAVRANRKDASPFARPGTRSGYPCPSPSSIVDREKPRQPRRRRRGGRLHAGEPVDDGTCMGSSTRCQPSIWGESVVFRMGATCSDDVRPSLFIFFSFLTCVGTSGVYYHQRHSRRKLNDVQYIPVTVCHVYVQHVCVIVCHVYVPV